MFPNPASRARTQYFLNKDSSNKYSCETIGDETSHSKVPDWLGGGKGCNYRQIIFCYYKLLQILGLEYTCLVPYHCYNNSLVILEQLDTANILISHWAFC